MNDPSPSTVTVERNRAATPWHWPLRAAFAATILVAAGFWAHSILFPSLGVLDECGCGASVHGWWFESTPLVKRGLVIDCSDSRLTDEVLSQEIERLRRLSPVYLDLRRSPVSAGASASIARLPSLLGLSIDGTMLTERGCRRIARIDSLKRLFVTGRGVDEMTLGRLITLLPERPTLDVVLFDMTISGELQRKIEASSVKNRLTLSGSTRIAER